MRCSRFFPLTAAVVGLLGLNTACPAQTMNVPRPGAVPNPKAATPTAPANDPGQRGFTPQQLKDRPYNGTLPKPAFPSTERVQRAFTIAYVYDYAFSAYTPTVTLPVMPANGVKRDTPEAAVVAVLSAMRTGNFDAFAACFAEPDRTALLQMKKDPAKLQALLAAWKQAFTNRTVELLDRVEVIGYVILDVRLTGASPQMLPNVFKLVDEQWSMTNDLGRSGDLFLGTWKADLAGTITHVQPVAQSELNGPATATQGRAQGEFLRGHNVRSTLVEAAQ